MLRLNSLAQEQLTLSIGQGAKLKTVSKHLMINIINTASTESRS